MRCPACRYENPPQAKFCLECGARLAVTCPNCRAELPPSAKFCLECGQRVTPPGAAIVPPSASPEAYTPQHLAERILTAKAALEGERKQVTVLFADLKGSMELLADRDPEDARKILDPVLAHMMDAVHRYEGTVNQVMGDGIMALFGAPIAHEDHAVRACYAALRMQESVNRYAEEARRAHGVTVQIRVGLNSGEVVVRAIGNDLHMDYTAVGETTHLAARMEQAARPGTVLIAPATLAPGRGVRRREGPWPGAGERSQRTRRDLRAVRHRSGAHATAGRRAARAHTVRRPGRRDRGASPIARAGRRGTRAGRRHRGRGRRGKIPPPLGVHAVAPRGRLARAQEPLGVLREGHAVPPRHRAAEGLSRDPGARRRAAGSRASDGQTPDTRPNAGAALDAAAGPARCARRRWRVGRPRPSTTPAAYPGSGQAAAPPGESGSTAPPGRRRPPLDRLREPGVARCPDRKPADRAHLARRRLPSRVPARLGEQDATTPSSGSIRCRPRAPKSCSPPSSVRTRASSPSSAC